METSNLRVGKLVNDNYFKIFIEFYLKTQLNYKKNIPQLIIHCIFDYGILNYTFIEFDKSNKKFIPQTNKLLPMNKIQDIFTQTTSIFAIDYNNDLYFKWNIFDQIDCIICANSV